MKWSSVTTKISQALLRRAQPIDLASLEDACKPLTRNFGFDRGEPIDRYYMRHFVESKRDLVNGEVLEVAERRYTDALGVPRARSTILSYVHHAEPGSGARADGVLSADLSALDTLPAEGFNCFICTQTLNVIYDVQAAVRGIRRLLRPGGVAIVTLPGLTQVSRFDMDRWGDYWRFTSGGAKRLFDEAFAHPGDSVELTVFGNALGAIALMRGAAIEDLPNPERLLEHDGDYQVVIGLVCRRAAATRAISS